MQLQVGDRVSANAHVRGADWAKAMFQSTNPECWMTVRIQGTLLNADWSKRYARWRVLWDNDGISSVLSSRALTRIDSAAAAAPAALSLLPAGPVAVAVAALPVPQSATLHPGPMMSVARLQTEAQPRDESSDGVPDSDDADSDDIGDSDDRSDDDSSEEDEPVPMDVDQHPAAPPPVAAPPVPHAPAVAGAAVPAAVMGPAPAGDPAVPMVPAVVPVVEAVAAEELVAAAHGLN